MTSESGQWAGALAMVEGFNMGRKKEGGRIHW